MEEEQQQDRDEGVSRQQRQQPGFSTERLDP